MYWGRRLKICIALNPKKRQKSTFLPDRGVSKNIEKSNVAKTKIQVIVPVKDGIIKKNDVRIERRRDSIYLCCTIGPHH